MLNKKTAARISTGFLMLLLLAVPQLSYADWGFHHDRGRFYRYHDHPRFGIHLHFLPHGYFTIRVGGARYYYYDGLYYRSIGGDYVIVSPPVGAVVTAIPSDFQPVIVNGVTYYVNNGTYYRYTRHGYQFVAPPLVVNPAVGSQDIVTVNVANNSGGYTAVVIRRSGNGYVGPQGEFYPEFPKVAQLKTMYGK
jgi:hypothetical protein